MSPEAGGGASAKGAGPSRGHREAGEGCGLQGRGCAGDARGWSRRERAGGGWRRGSPKPGGDLARCPLLFLLPAPAGEWGPGQVAGTPRGRGPWNRVDLDGGGGHAPVLPAPPSSHPSLGNPKRGPLGEVWILQRRPGRGHQSRTVECGPSSGYGVKCKVEKQDEKKGSHIERYKGVLPAEQNASGIQSIITICISPSSCPQAWHVISAQ